MSDELGMIPGTQFLFLYVPVNLENQFSAPKYSDTIV